MDSHESRGEQIMKSCPELSRMLRGGAGGGGFQASFSQILFSVLIERTELRFNQRSDDPARPAELTDGFESRSLAEFSKPRTRCLAPTPTFPKLPGSR